MNDLLKRIAENTSDAGAFVGKLTDSGIQSVCEVFKGMKIYGALSATSVDYLEVDETHYLLVPVLGAQREYAIYTKRILPPDTGAINSLPKVRYFHVPDETGRERLEQELVENIVDRDLSDDCGSSDFADALEKVADQIDRETTKISGGLLLIGGAIAIVNPVLGVSLAVKSLLPSVGVKASKIGAEYVGNKLRGWNKSSEVSKLNKDASKEVSQLKPKIYPNPILLSLDAISANPETGFEPEFDDRNWSDAFESVHFYRVTQEAIREVYKDILDTMDLDVYQKGHVSWIKSFIDTPEI